MPTYWQEYYEKNKAWRRRQALSYYYKNQEKRKKASRDYHAANRDEHLKQQREYRAKNRLVIKVAKSLQISRPHARELLNDSVHSPSNPAV